MIFTFYAYKADLTCCSTVAFSGGYSDEMATDWCPLMQFIGRGICSGATSKRETPIVVLFGVLLVNEYLKHQSVHFFWSDTLSQTATQRAAYRLVSSIAQLQSKSQGTTLILANRAGHLDIDFAWNACADSSGNKCILVGHSQNDPAVHIEACDQVDMHSRTRDCDHYILM